MVTVPAALSRSPATPAPAALGPGRCEDEATWPAVISRCNSAPHLPCLSTLPWRKPLCFWDPTSLPMWASLTCSVSLKPPLCTLPWWGCSEAAPDEGPSFQAWSIPAPHRQTLRAFSRARRLSPRQPHLSPTCLGNAGLGGLQWAAS